MYSQSRLPPIPSSTPSVFTRLKSIQTLALNLGASKRMMDSWKDEMELRLVRLSISSPSHNSEEFERVEKSLREMQAHLAADQSILDVNGNLVETWRTSSFFAEETRKESNVLEKRPFGPRRSRSETINEGWVNVPRSPVGSPMVESPESAKSQGGGIGGRETMFR